MKKLIIAIVVIAAVGGGYAWLRKQKLPLDVFAAKIESARRGDLTIPIKASGKIQPKSKREIKSKASGEIIAIPVDVGQLVKRDQILVKLKEDDETRNRDAAKEAYVQAQIAVQLADIDLRTRREVALPAAEASRRRADAQLNRVRAEYEFKKNLKETSPDAIPSVEWVTIQAQYEIAQVDVETAKADVAKAQLAVDAGAKEIERLKSAAAAAESRWKDAEQRLVETTVRSPIDGMVLKRYRNVGEMIQSGTQSLTGGTVLMEIADVSEIYMIASVDEADIGKVRDMAPARARPGFAQTTTTQPTTKELVQQDTIQEDTPVEVTVEAFPDELFHGIIERISPESEIQAAVATFEVRIRVTSDNREKIRGYSGIQAEAKFTSVPVRNALLVPFEAAQRGPTGELGVYVPAVKAGGSEEEPRFQPCKFGSNNGVDVVVLEGIQDGQRVYTKLPVKTRTEKKAAGEETD